MTDPSLFPPALRDAILAWYAGGTRSLPFRGTTDPYAILVSEVMAQQTQATRAGEAWARFMGRFPTVEILAVTTPADVLRAWHGLGYNRRALDLWRTAGRIVGQFGGLVPRDLAALQSLPGVGPYTARAVAALAFGLPVGAVDTNVRRVLGRIVAGEVGVLAPGALQRVADAVVPPDRPGEWTHALMDIGATLCHPRRPDCGPCPASLWCRYANASEPRNDAEPGNEAETGNDAIVRAAPGRARATAGRLRAASGRTRAETGTSARTGTGAIARAAPFRTTSRWLRGRIVDRLRQAPNGEWVVLADTIGGHDRAAIEVATRSMANEGMLELDGTEPVRLRARLPIA